jgi:hypothetical protein
LKKCESVAGKFAPQSNCQDFYPLQRTPAICTRPHTSYGIPNKVPPTYDSQKGFLSARPPLPEFVGEFHPEVKPVRTRTTITNPSEPPAMPRFNKFTVEQSPPLQVPFTEPNLLAKVLKLPDGLESPRRIEVNRNKSLIL